jgi:DNA-binding protein HU-beta
MNQGDLAAAVAEAIGEKKGDAAKAVEAVLAAVREGLERDGEVAIAGFGSFETLRREAREGRNPRTGKPVQVAASTTVKLKPD